MSTIKIVYSFIVTLALVAIIYGCQKIVPGFISDNMYYIENPFFVSQGVTTTSSPLVADGSTAPLTVKILSLKDSLGNNADSILTTPRTIVTYTGTVTYKDTTLDMLKAKLKDSLVRPFNVGETGGRLEFTAATTFVPTGTYKMDISVTNEKGTKVINNACNFIIQPLSNVYNLLYKRVRYWDNGTGDGGANAEDLNGIRVDVAYTSGTTDSKVIYKYLDQNDKPFNPSKGEVVRYRSDWPAFTDWDPYYKPVLTDSTMEFQIPNIGLSFPYFPNVTLNGMDWPDTYTAKVYYKIVPAANKKHQLVQVLSSLQFLTSGTYVVTIHIPNTERETI